MACDGYEHNARVELINDLPRYKIFRGEKGTVVGVNKSQHTINVEFDNYGVFKNLNPHSFKLDKNEPEPMKAFV